MIGSLGKKPFNQKKKREENQMSRWIQELVSPVEKKKWEYGVIK